MVYSDANDPEPDYRYETVIKVVVIHDGMESCLDMWLGGHKMQTDLMASLLKYLSYTMLTL